MIGCAKYSITEWEWLKVQLRLRSREISAPKFQTRYTFADSPGQSLKQRFPDAVIECSFWCETTKLLLEKKASRTEHLEYYSRWVHSEEVRLGEIIASFPEMSKEFDFKRHIAYAILHAYGMGSLAICHFYGEEFRWPVSRDMIPE